MVTIKVGDRGQYYLNKKMKAELDVALYAVKYKNQDLVLIFDGPEGSGKSTAARQLAHYCAMRLESYFDVDGVTHIHNDLDKYIRSSSEGKKFEVHILDEARKVLNRKRSIGKEAVRFTNYLSECRFMNQVHILCIPAYHDLDRYVAQWRVAFVIHMIKEWRANEEIELGGHELHLGSFKMYMNDSYLKRHYDLSGFHYPKKWVTRDRFNGFEILSPEGEEAYENQKFEAMKKKYVDEGIKKDSPKDQARKFQRICEFHGVPLPPVIYADYHGVSERTVYRWLENNSVEEFSKKAIE